MNKFVEEKDINVGKIIDRLGDLSYGDEDFELFKCPSCNNIFLIDSEVEAIFPVDGYWIS